MLPDGTPVPSPPPQPHYDLILCHAPGHEGVWVKDVQSLSFRQHRTLQELVWGYCHRKLNKDRDRSQLNYIGPPDTGSNAFDRYMKFGLRHVADERQWQFLIGLCVCELAERVQLK
jgi:hypothetical protein